MSDQQPQQLPEQGPEHTQPITRSRPRRAICIEDWCMVPKDCVELAIVENEELGCEANIGRLVAVLGEEVEGKDGSYWLPIMPMHPRPWAMIDDSGEVKLVPPRKVWMRLVDLMSTQCFPPESRVPGFGPADDDVAGEEWMRPLSRLSCKPGDLVVVAHSDWHPEEFMPSDMKAQLGRVGVVLGYEAMECEGPFWRWTVKNVSSTPWVNEYSVGGQVYTLEENTMLVEDQRLIRLAQVMDSDGDGEDGDE